MAHCLNFSEKTNEVQLGFPAFDTRIILNEIEDNPLKELIISGSLVGDGYLDEKHNEGDLIYLQNQ